jgi:hypothetical protein
MSRSPRQTPADATSDAASDVPDRCMPAITITGERESGGDILLIHRRPTVLD